MKKFKVVEKFEMVKSLLNGEPTEGFTLKDALEFLDERIVITEKKNASGANAERKPTKTQLENEGVKAEIIEYLRTCDAPVTISDMQKNSVELSNYTCQKISALLTQLIKSKVVVRSEVKGKAYFALATEV